MNHAGKTLLQSVLQLVPQSVLLVSPRGRHRVRHHSRCRSQRRLAPVQHCRAWRGVTQQLLEGQTDQILVADLIAGGLEAGQQVGQLGPELRAVVELFEVCEFVGYHVIDDRQREMH